MGMSFLLIALLKNKVSRIGFGKLHKSHHTHFICIFKLNSNIFLQGACN
jgi:hypothetical protein